MAITVEEVLATWRASEALLTELAPDSPDRPSMLAQIERMRALYHSLAVVAPPPTADAVASTHDEITSARAALRAVRSHLESPAGSGA